MENSDKFEDFKQQKQILEGFFSETSEVLQELSSESAMTEIQEEAKRLSSDTFKVLVIGEFKRGKSTFINALFGENVLPSYTIPCTAVINEIKWGEQKKAIVHFIEKIPEKLPEKLAADVVSHIQKYKGQSVPPKEIPLDRLKEFVTIPDPGKDQSESVSESPFSLVEIYWPLEFCKNGVELIDSPGLNEHGTRTKVTKNYLEKVDAIIFVLSCEMLASETEMSVIDNNIRSGGHEAIFFICNRFDCIPKNEREELRNFANDKLSSKTTLSSEGIHFLSARNALEAKEDNDLDALNKSGFPQMEKQLVTFLVDNRGKIKLLRPASSLRQRLKKAIRETIPQQEKLLSEDLASIQKKYDMEKPNLEKAERKRIEINAMIKTHCEKTQNAVYREVNTFMRNLSNEVRDW